MKTARQRAQDLLNRFVELGLDPLEILEFILNNHLSGSEAEEALLAVRDEFLDEGNGVDEDDATSFDENEE